MESQYSDIKKLIEDLDEQSAIEKLKGMMSDKDCTFEKDKIYYIIGNLYRKKNNFQMALNNYLEAISINPQSPALQARDMIMDILNFYNKDMYNQ